MAHVYHIFQSWLWFLLMKVFDWPIYSPGPLLNQTPLGLLARAYPAFRLLDCFRYGISASLLTQSQKLALQLKCDLENVTNLRASGDDFRWQCALTVDRSFLILSTFVLRYVVGVHIHWLSYVKERVALKDSRGDANLIIRCKFCNRIGNVDIVSGSDAAYNAEDSGRFKTILVFECRGVELIAFSPRAGWSADGLDSGTSFVDISLSDEMTVDLFAEVGNWFENVSFPVKEKRFQANFQALRADQHSADPPPANTPEVPIFRHIDNQPYLSISLEQR
ncbi:hypothetical protein T265_01902 [Opisthorchis viverrini]|uniref:Uncharacterized protein n=1 Tax=Opisthorchis viverrini TaxID=6198 RepID=A0A075A8C0_OPIVI|nr:hypothetical protein T265_01902 [Opisthorchis viverrini]KER31970.1 hypothetical protein T265_01902 [Opisthorchis viverrini]